MSSCYCICCGRSILLILRPWLGLQRSQHLVCDESNTVLPHTFTFMWPQTESNGPCTGYHAQLTFVFNGDATTRCSTLSTIGVESEMVGYYQRDDKRVDFITRCVCDRKPVGNGLTLFPRWNNTTIRFTLTIFTRHLSSQSQLECPLRRPV